MFLFSDTNTLPQHRSFFQGLCVLGYCIAPLDIAAFISCFVRIIYVRAPIALLAWAWCIWGKHLIMSLIFSSSPYLVRRLSICQFLGRHQNRATTHPARSISSSVSRATRHPSVWNKNDLPIRLFYFVLAWMILIQ